MSIVRFIDALRRDYSGAGVKRQLDILCRVYAISLLVAHAGDFLSTGYLTERQISLAKQQLRALFHEVLLNILAEINCTKKP
jgi:acyl-CoA oxidase